MNDLLTEGQREEIGRRVHDGAVMFDQRGPLCWAQVLSGNASRLDAGSCTSCPLGILYGDYVDGLAALNLTSAEASSLGLTIVEGDGFDDGSHGGRWENAAWAAMSAAWVREAWQRVAAATT